MPRRVFLDTNVWFSALYGSDNCNRLLQAAHKNVFRAIISSDVLDELIVNLKRKIPAAFPRFEEEVILVDPKVMPTPLLISAEVKRAVDKKDRKIFAAAVTADADYFVTGNIKDFKKNKQKKIGNITILTPKEAVEVLGLS